MEEVTQIHADAHRKALEEVKADLDREISIFKGEVLGILREVSSSAYISPSSFSGLLTHLDVWFAFYSWFSCLKTSKRCSEKKA